MSIVEAHDSAALRRKMLALMGGASAVSLMCAMPAYAQDDTGSDPVVEEDDDVVVARGIRRSLQSAQDIKRDADTFVDAVTAEDIGALPDRSVTEALQRVPGVQISRFAAADDPDHFSIEGQGVLVRGLTFVRSELNGRDTFSANNGRALSFADVPPELLGSVQVYKNQTADLIEGGIAGSVNLVTRKPFDQSGQLLAGAVEYNYGDFREEWTPTVSGLYSNSWEGDFGRVGVLVNGVFSELKSRSDGSQISSFRVRDDFLLDGFSYPSTADGSGPFLIPDGAVIRSQEYDRERMGYGGSVQWENPDQTILATAEFLRSEATTAWTENVSEIATDNVTAAGGSFIVPGTEFGFDDQGLFAYGQISGPTGWRGDQNGADPRTPIYGLQSNNQRRGVDQEYVTQDASINLKITPNDRWSFNLDYQFIDSTVSNVDFTLWGSSFQDLYLDLRGDIPDIVFLAPSEGAFGRANSGIEYNCDAMNTPSNTCPTYFNSNNASFADPYNSFWRAAMDHFEDSEGTEQAFRADAQYNFFDDVSWLDSMRVGARWAERDQTTRFSTYNWGALSEIWGNNGPIWLDELGVPGGFADNIEFGDYQRGEVTQPPSFPYTTYNPALDYNQAADFADSVVDAWLAQGNNTGGAQGGGGGWRRLAERPGVVAGTPYLPGEIADVLEENMAAYVRFDYTLDNFLDSGMVLDGNFGLRYVKTTLTSNGSYQFPENSTVPTVTGFPSINDPDNPDFPGGMNRCLAPIEDDMGPGTGTAQDPFETPEFCDLSAEQIAAINMFANGGSFQVDDEHEYDIWLPSFNAKLNISDDVLLRFAYSKSLSRPDVGALRNNYSLSLLTQDDPRTVEDENPVGGAGYYGFTAAGGNPYLEPVKADNYDLSVEWYFADVGSLTVSAFYKEIEDIIVGGQGDLVFSNNGVTIPNVFTRQPTNSDQKGSIEGFEIAYQQFYDFLPEPFDGFGSQITYTFINSDGVDSSRVGSTSSTPAGAVDPDTGAAQSEPVVDCGAFPLEGLSENNWNVAGIFEKGPVSTRLVYNWRSEYLVTCRDVIVPYYPIFQEDSGQLDGSFFWSVNENVKIGIQAANLLDEVTETTAFIPDSGGLKGPRSYFRNDRRFTVSARFSF